MSMVSLYFVGLSVWQAIYASTLDEASNRLITLVSIMSSVFTLVLALIEAMNDYRMKAHHMHTCALAVNDLYHELQADASRSTPASCRSSAAATTGRYAAAPTITRASTT